jgi:hypothetical protein
MTQQRLSGSVNLVRALAGHDLWFAEKFCRQAALVDLLLLANTDDATAPARAGTKVEVPRGGVAYSIQHLARRWQWSDVKVTGYLRELQQQGVVKVDSTSNGTVIRFVNYDTYNPRQNNQPLATDLAGGLAAGLATDLAGELATDLAQSRSRSNSKGVEGELEESPLPPKGGRGSFAEEPSWGEFLGYCETVAQGPIPEDFARSRFSDYENRAMGWPRNWRRAILADWQDPLKRGEWQAKTAKFAQTTSGAPAPAKTVSASVHVISEAAAIKKGRAECEDMMKGLDDGSLSEDFRRKMTAEVEARRRELDRREKALEAAK